ncbi:hypothetical protein ERX35_005230 [Macrococcus equipercicus]|uniref:Phage protein n=1 Tax=Macrococcus equipercicus TaxID=69967 RepID=A0ABQ6R8K2_9STAP|nr:hypothetical protein [Macrococcus equipercicus]KAA1039482.1 hypothetical protein ERX35_005230 [Macrococcus equipercicus]
MNVKLFKRGYVDCQPYADRYGGMTDRRKETQEEYEARLNEFLEQHHIIDIKPIYSGDWDEDGGGVYCELMVMYEPMKVNNPFAKN